MNGDRREQKIKLWKRFYKLNNYYHKYIQDITKHLIPKDASVLELSSRGGELLAALPNKLKIGVNLDPELDQLAGKVKKIKILSSENFTKELKGKKFDYIVFNNTFEDTYNVQNFVKQIKKYSHSKTKVLVFYFNYIWKPILDAGEKLGLRLPQDRAQNWLSTEDIDNFFYLESFDKVKAGKRFIVPYEIPYLSEFVNKYISPLPIINILSLINYAIYRPIPEMTDYSVSIVIPARNEAGNMKGIFKKIPKFAKKIELIFVEGHSSDDTYQTIKKEINKYKGPFKAHLYKQKGKGKGDAVRLGFSKAKNELLMILDADLTVDPKELPKFYKAATEGKGELIMGSRLIYPMEKQAMRTLNVLGNKFFSIAFSFLLDQRIKDTLCGTKVILKSDYERIAKNRKVFGDFDPFGDYDLIFGAAKLNLKIIEIPIRYKERTYGTTNISRFTHGWLLLKMAYFAAKNLKFI